MSNDFFFQFLQSAYQECMNFTQIGDGPCYYHWNEICDGLIHPVQGIFDSHLPHWHFLTLLPIHCWFLLSKLRNENLGKIKYNSENVWIPLFYAVFLQAYVWNGAHNFYETFFLPFFAAVRSSFIKSCVQILFFVKETRAFWVKGFLAMQFQITGSTWWI